MGGDQKLELNKNSDDHLEGFGYKITNIGWFLYGLLTILSGGFVLLVFHWKPEWKIRILYSRCAVSEANVFLLEDRYHQQHAAQVTFHPVPNKIGNHQSFATLNENGEISPRTTETSIDSDNQPLLDENSSNQVRCFQYIDYHNIRYVWSEGVYKRQHGLDQGIPCMSFHNDYNGLSVVQREISLFLYGLNNIEVQVKSYVRLFFEEVVNPFYIFQVASIILWMSDQYYYYAIAIIIISLLSIGTSLYETKKQSVTLHNMVKSPEQQIWVQHAPGDRVLVNSLEIVPGDVIEIPPAGCLMQCDAVLMAGNCIVNEAMLTGESVPVTKTPLPHTADDEMYSPDEYKRHTLFCGTQVLQTRYYGNTAVKAIVVRTGFHTAKGDLIRSILHPKPMDFKFYTDAIKFILVLAVLASLGMGFTVYIMTYLHKNDVGTIIKRVLDIVTIVVPPALPAAMTVGMVYAQNRLRKQGIFCISPPRINLCGKLKLFCFDKTGTLTEDGLDLWGILPTKTDQTFSDVLYDCHELPRGPFLTGMAACHSITHMDGELNGDPLDLKMFEATGWILEEPGEDTSRFDCLMPTVVRPPTDSTTPVELFPGVQTSYEVGIVKQFPFSSSLQRMSVITRTLGANNMELLTKGAPEKIISMCKPDTVPDDFPAVLRKYTVQGFRVIASAVKDLDKLSWHHAQRITRDQVETDMTFTGLLIMRNTLKPETSPVIQQLSESMIRTVMVTGDNILTAISVARECHMVHADDKVILVQATGPVEDQPAKLDWIDQQLDDRDIEETTPCAVEEIDEQSGDDSSYQLLPSHERAATSYHLAVDGKSFAIILQHLPHLMPKVCVRGTIFARMAPHQKAQLVEQLQALGYGVGMCGDGANDCSALKTAHAGISLSEAEASVASPFTSRIPNIKCVPTVIREGRAALTTSFGCFKYMALYSLIQFVTVLILYWAGTNISDMEFLYIDLVITTTVAFLMGHTEAYHKLIPTRPRGSLFSFANITSLLLQILLMAVVQIASFLYLYQQPWFKPFKPAKDSADLETAVPESTLMFLVSSFQYLMLAINFSIGPPYRKRIWSNKLFFFSSILLTLLSLMLLFYPTKPIEKFLGMAHIEYKYLAFRVILIFFLIIQMLISSMIETYMIPSVTFSKFSRWLRGKRKPNNKYKRVALEIEEDINWPPNAILQSTTKCVKNWYSIA